MQMPRIDLDRLEGELPPEEFSLVRGIVATRGVNKGCLRASKPKVTRRKVGVNEYGHDVIEPDRVQGETAYVWRMVVFAVSPKRQHLCLPVTADWDVPGRWGDEKRARLDELNRIADVVIKTIPLERHVGTMLWGKALGYF